MSTKAVIHLDDVKLARVITASLPDKKKECLETSFRKYQTLMQTGLNTEEAQYRFCRYMEMYWLVTYSRQNDYSKLQEITYAEWREKAEDIYRHLLQHHKQIERTGSW